MSRPTDEQIAALKKTQPNAILIFRCEKSYAAYGPDAIRLAGLTGLPVVCGVSWFDPIRLEWILKTIVDGGGSAAVCEQVVTEVAKCKAKGSIERIVTPGKFDVQVTDDDGEAD